MIIFNFLVFLLQRITANLLPADTLLYEAFEFRCAVYKRLPTLVPCKRRIIQIYKSEKQCIIAALPFELIYP